MTLITAEKNNAKDLRHKPYYNLVYYFVFFAFIILFLILVFATNGNIIKGILFQNKSDTFMDHFNSVIYNEIDPYNNHVIYPPLACVFYKICNKMIPRDVYYGIISNPTTKSQPVAMKISQGFVLPFMIYFILTALLFLISISLLKKGGKLEKVAFCTTIAFSTPLLFAVERGNNILIPLAFSIFFIGFYDHKNKWVREASFICLAIAVGFKLYPCLFAVVLLSEKKWREFLRVVIYCIITTILPFFVFYGGISALKLMIGSIFGFSGKRTSDVRSLDNALDFRHIFIFCFNISKPVHHLEFSDELLSLLANVAKYIMALVCGLCALLLRENWKKTLFVSCIIYGFPGSCSTYLLLFFIIPAILLIDTEKKPKVINYIYVVLLLATQVPISVGHDGVLSRYMSTNISSVAVGIICFMGLIELVILAVNFLKTHKTARKKVMA